MLSIIKNRSLISVASDFNKTVCVSREEIRTDLVLEVQFDLHQYCVSLLMDTFSENSLRSDSDAIIKRDKRTLISHAAPTPRRTGAKKLLMITDLRLYPEI